MKIFIIEFTMFLFSTICFAQEGRYVAEINYGLHCRHASGAICTTAETEDGNTGYYKIIEGQEEYLVLEINISKLSLEASEAMLNKNLETARLSESNLYYLEEDFMLPETMRSNLGTTRKKVSQGNYPAIIKENMIIVKLPLQ